MRPIEIVKTVCPTGRDSYLAAIDAGDGLFIKAELDTPLRMAHFLAQVLHETGGLRIEHESGNYKTADRLFEIFGEGHHSAKLSWDEAIRLVNMPMPDKEKAIFERVYGLGNPRKAQELGNSQPGDGWKYRGAGILQTTGRANYRRMGEKCGVDFEGNPDLVLSAEHALKPALAEWTEGNLNAAADRDDIIAITKRINGGLNGLDDRRMWYRRVRPLIHDVDFKGIETS